MNGLYSGSEAKRYASADYAVFDDISGGIKCFPHFKQWLGAQQQFQVKVLYRDPMLINWGKPCIWVANTDPRHDMTSQDIEWMEANCIFASIETSLIAI